MHGSVAIYAAMRMINFTDRVFGFLFVLMIISFSIFKVIVIGIWTNIEPSEKPPQSKFSVVFLDKSISL